MRDVKNLDQSQKSVLNCDIEFYMLHRCSGISCQIIFFFSSLTTVYDSREAT